MRDPCRASPPRVRPVLHDKEAGRGVGLGLAVCQSLIEQHGGTVRVESRGVGQGTTVEFELPAES